MYYAVFLIVLVVYFFNAVGCSDLYVKSMGNAFISLMSCLPVV